MRKIVFTHMYTHVIEASCFSCSKFVYSVLEKILLRTLWWPILKPYQVAISLGLSESALGTNRKNTLT